ncbi:MAG: hypothetical protein KAX93_06285 [Flavobacterium sp.]|nr:hypothetical protein [Flavobacterium sp.]
MKHLLRLTLLFLVTFSKAQTGIHTPSDWVQDAFFSKDGNKCLTISTAETILWDMASKKPIWVKKTADFGVPYKMFYSFFTTADPDLNFIIIRDDLSVRNLVNLNTFKVTRWNYDNCHFTSDGRIAVVERDFNKKNANKLVLIDPKSLQSEVIVDKINAMDVYESGKKIFVVKKKGDSNDFDNVRTYDVETKKFFDESLGPINKFRKIYYYKNGYYIVYQPNEIQVKKADNTTFNIKTHNPNVERISSYSQRLCPTYDNPETVKMLEHKIVRDGYYLSFINTYNITNGQLTDTFELTNTNEKANQVAVANEAQKNKVWAEEQNRLNLPENVLKRRLFQLQDNFYYNTNTKGIYYVVPGKPIYEGDLVLMDALHDDPKQKMEVYEKIDNLENAALYKYTVRPKSCSHCNGKGYISNSYKSTVADYEYTTGKKLVETTTRTNSCGNCGGCGLVPNF